jgi:hypothetical protein
MKTKLTLFVAVIAAALFGFGCASGKSVEENKASNRISLINPEGVVGTYEWSTNEFFAKPKGKWSVVLAKDGMLRRHLDGVLRDTHSWKIEGASVVFQFGNRREYYMRTKTMLMLSHTMVDGKKIRPQLGRRISWKKVK